MINGKKDSMRSLFLLKKKAFKGSNFSFSGIYLRLNFVCDKIQSAGKKRMKKEKKELRDGEGMVPGEELKEIA